MSKRKKRKNKSLTITLILIVLICLYYNFESEIKEFINSYAYSNESLNDNRTYNIGEIPAYSGEEYIIINNNEPYFDFNNLPEEEFESYSDLDSLGRCGVAYANIGSSLMPTEERGSIGMVKPSGWHTVRYDDLVPGKYLYNRCHLIGYQLTGENANTKNLITCTRAMNTGVMLEYENMVANYIKKTNNHVLYRVTPIFEADNLVASGVEMEGYSIEDKGVGIKFNIYIYNVQEGIEIDYKTGESKLKEQ